ncbi:hypothetical protein [Jiulongibacter sp. NS-SX5]|uniref:hypothetical protein n=1 Tax=Jiulongibacter sp. NS-SX5 TaxID=3463854 RepID=UPI004058D1D6
MFFDNQITNFINLLFILAFAAPILMVTNLVKNTSIESLRWKLLAFYLVYIVVVVMIGAQGFFEELRLPPRIVLVTTIPLLLFYLFIVSNTPTYKTWLPEIETTRLIRVHIFRLIGVFFLVLFYFEKLPKPFALIAGLGDMITAISSIFVAKAFAQKKSFSKKLLLIWNTFGLVDILLTSAMAVYFTKLSIDTGLSGVEVLARFPFYFIPAFAPATIIFLHLSLYRKVLRNL